MANEHEAGIMRLGVGIVKAVRPPELEVELLVHVQAGPEAGHLIRRIAPGGSFDVFVKPHPRRPDALARAEYFREGIERGFITSDHVRHIEGLAPSDGAHGA